MSHFTDKINNALKKGWDFVRKPAQFVPPLLLLCEVARRPGLSAIAVTTAILSRLEAVGIPTGAMPDGSPNLSSLEVKIIVEEIFKEIRENSLVESVVPSSTVVSVGTGANAGGPVAITSLNQNASKVYGVIR